jgi:hypothetical protein
VKQIEIGRGRGLVGSRKLSRIAIKKRKYPNVLSRPKVLIVE